MLKVPILECISDPNVSSVYARLRRHDGKFYNPATKSFDGSSTTKIPMTRGSGPDLYVWMATPLEESEEFTPGRYTTFYHDNIRLCGATYEDIGDEVVVISPKFPTVEEIAEAIKLPTADEIASKITFPTLSDISSTINQAFSSLTFPSLPPFPKIPTVDEIAVRLSALQMADGPLKTSYNAVTKKIDEMYKLFKSSQPNNQSK